MKQSWINICYVIILSAQISHSITQNFVPISFDVSMTTSYMHNALFACTDPQWQFIRKAYNKHMLDDLNVKKCRIPKKIHQIWLGSPYPEKYKALQKSWRDLHPDWEFKVWTDADVDAFRLKNIALFKKATNWGQKSDIWRLEILDRYGGLYIDTDFLCLKPFDILHYACDFYIGIAHSKTVVFYNGLIGAAPGHPIIKKCIEKISLGDGSNTEESIQRATGPHFITKCFFDVAPNIKRKCVVFPITFFYPFPNSHRIYSNDVNIVRSFIRPESYCVHLWEYSWAKNK